METLIPSETLEEGSVISQLDRAQDPFGKTLEQASGLSSLSENCSGFVSASEVSVRENGAGADVSGVTDMGMRNVEVLVNQIINVGERVEGVEGGSLDFGAGTVGDGICFGFGGIEMGSLVDEVVAEESHMKGGSLEPNFEGLPISHSSDITNADSLVYGNEEIGADKVTMEGVEVGDASQLNGFDSDKKVEVYGKGISLFVEVFGLSDGLVQGDDSKFVGESELMGGNLNEGNGILLPRTGEYTSAKVSEIQDSMLDVTENGTIYIGNEVEGEAIVNQENRTTFPAGTKEGDMISVNITGELGEFSVAQFEPKKFLGYVKDRAKDVSDPGMIECTVMQNRLSAFYHSIGHQQLHMDQLVPSTQGGSDVADEGIMSSDPASKFRKRKRSKDSSDSSYEAEYIVLDKMGSSGMKITSPTMSSKSTESKVSSLENGDVGRDVIPEKGYESRERRKSKYLSPPYVNLIGSGVPKSSLASEQHEIEDLKAVSRAATRSVESHGKKLQNKLSKKRITGLDLSGTPQTLNASSAEMLSELRITALDCCYPDDRRIDLVERYILGFRKFVYCNIFVGEIAKENSGEVHTEKGKGMEEVTVEHLSVSGEKDPQEMSHGSPNAVPIKRRRKKTEEKTSAGSKPKRTAGLSNKKRSITSSGGTGVIDFQNTGSLAPEGQIAPKKRRKLAGATPGLPQINVVGGVPDLNQDNNGLPVEGPQVAGAVAPQGKLEPKRRKRKEGVASKRSKSKTGETISGFLNIEGSKAKLVPVLKDVQVMGLNSLQSVPEPSNNEGIKVAPSLHTDTQPDINGNNVDPNSCMKDPLKMGTLFPSDKPARKKRVRKEKASDSHTNATSALPDLNGNTAEGKTQQKRRRNKAAAPVVSDFDYSKLQTNGEAQGTALLLKFAPELPMPSKEALVSAFSGFGELKESETQVLNDSFSAQVVFMGNTNARDAFRSLEKSSPFGSSLVNYRLLDLSAASTILEPDVNQRIPQFGPVEKPKTPPKKTKRTPVKPKIPVKPKVAPAKPSGLKPQQGEAPNLVCIRQNLEVMTSMLEKAGDTLSAEMRAKLENDIKGLLAKVGTMVSSTSSS